MARILLADDDHGSRDMVRRALEMDGHVVAVAEDGNDALAQLSAQQKFDVLVSDVQMPGLDGIALAERAAALCPAIHVIMMSGYTGLLDKARTLNARSVRLLAKPFSIDKVRAEVRAALA